MTTSSTVTITAIAGFPYINGMNASGIIAGGTLDAGDPSLLVPLVYSGGQVSVLPTGTAGFGDTRSINDQGTIAGFIMPQSGVSQAAIWQNGALTLLQGLSGDASSAAIGINRSGLIVGDSGPTASTDDHALVWQSASASPTVLPTLPGQTAAFAWAVNDVGVIVGNSDDTYSHAVMWQNGVVSALATVPNETSSFALAINHSSQIVGNVIINHKQELAALWENGTITTLQGLGGTFSEANGINDLGQVVGDATDANGTQSAVVWQHGEVINLNSLMPANSGWVLATATAIDDKGDIAGMGYYNGTQYGFYLTLGHGVSADASPAQSAVANFATGGVGAKVALTDSAAHVSATLDGLQSLALANELGAVVLSDAGVPALTLDARQLATDASTLAAITSPYSLTVTADAASEAIAAPAGHGMAVVFSGDASQYTVSAGGGGIEVSGDGAVYQLTGATSLEFADYGEIVALAPSETSTTTGNVTELYAAVLNRQPDVAGLAYYQEMVAANPSLSMATLARSFLASPEYTGNAAHDYAATAAGDIQFITDTYTNLLHRAPGTGDVAWYQANVLAPLLGNAAPGSAAYADAQAAAHAQLLVDFSASAEFLADVQVTAQHPADAQHWLVLV